MILRGNRKTVTQEETLKILELAKHGLKGTVISRVLERSPQPIYRILRAYGVPILPEERTKAQLDNALVMFSRGGTAKPSPKTPSGRSNAIDRMVRWVSRREKTPRDGEISPVPVLAEAGDGDQFHVNLSGGVLGRSTADETEIAELRRRVEVLEIELRMVLIDVYGDGKNDPNHWK